MMDNITPTGITIGANNVLPNVSANIIKKAPKIPEHGINFLKSLPTTNLDMWGAASPTKPIRPVNAIIIDVMNAERMRMFFLILLGSTPVEMANSSPPIERVLRSHAQTTAVGNSANTTNAIRVTCFELGRDKLPNDQCASCESCASDAKYCIVETIAPQMNVIAIPTKIYDSADIDLNFPSWIIIATTINENNTISIIFSTSRLYSTYS